MEDTVIAITNPVLLKLNGKDLNDSYDFSDMKSLTKQPKSKVKKAWSPSPPPPGSLIEDFNLLFKIFLIGGINFPYSQRQQKRSSTIFATIFEIIVNVTSCSVIAGNVFLWQKRYSSATLHFTTMLTLCMAVTVRFVVICNKKQIPIVIRQLVRLYEDVNWKTPHKPLRNYILLGCSMVILVSILATVLEIVTLERMKALSEHSIEFLLDWDSKDESQVWMHNVLLALVPIKTYFAYCVPILTLIFCCTVYTVIKRTTRELMSRIQCGNRNKSNCRQTVLSSYSISLYLSLYNRLCEIVADIDKALSPCVFLLYGLIVSGQFFNISVLISTDTKITNVATILTNIIIFTLTTGAFLAMTLMAACVSEDGEDLKRAMHEMAEGLSSTNSNHALQTKEDQLTLTLSFLMLAAVVNGSHLNFTGWRMFNINRSFILTTTGVMISYGVILVQFGKS